MKKGIVLVVALALVTGVASIVGLFSQPVLAAEPAPVFLTKWDGSESAGGPLAWPVGIAVDSNDDVYVVNQLTHEVQKFDSEGNYVTHWGSYGSGKGQFDNPHGVAVDSSGNVYVADSNNHRIQKFDGDGNYLTQWNGQNSSGGPFDFVKGIALDSDDNIYVISDENDLGTNDRVVKFDSSGDYLYEWGQEGFAAYSFQAPWGIVVDSGGTVYVSEAGFTRIMKFDNFGNHLLNVVTSSSVRGVTVDAADNILVAENSAQRVRMFDGDGTVLTEWGEHGEEDGHFVSPHDVAVDSAGNIYVVDRARGDVQKFGPAGSDDTDPPVITLNGAASITLEVGLESYSEFGATVSDNDPDYNGTVTIGGDTVDTSTRGTYVITYDAPADPAGNVPTQIIRTVHVVDTTPPVITLNGAASITLEVGLDSYSEPGASVTDNDPEYNGTVTIGGDTVDTSTRGTYTVTYEAPADLSGNAPLQVTRTVSVVDTTPPVIHLLGDNPLELIEGEAYEDPGATVTDNSGEDLAGALQIDASGVDTVSAGTYEVTYSVSDSSGNVAVSNRTVQVISPAEAVDNLIGTVMSLNLQHGVDNSLDAKLNAAKQALDDLRENNDAAAINALQAFISSVEAQRDKSLTSVQADMLVAAAERIIEALT